MTPWLYAISITAYSHGQAQENGPAPVMTPCWPCAAPKDVMGRALSGFTHSPTDGVALGRCRIVLAIGYIEPVA